jgi:hypothetical protein
MKTYIRETTDENLFKTQRGAVGNTNLTLGGSNIKEAVAPDRDWLTDVSWVGWL